MKKLKLRRRYWRKRSGPRGRRQSEVCVIDENHDNLIVHTILRHAPGIFQNIHDSFDEIDSKTLNNVYRKSTQPARVKSGEPWPQYVILILNRTKFDKNYSDYLIILYYQEPASGRRTLPGPSPAPLWQRRSVEMLTRA